MKALMILALVAIGSGGAIAQSVTYDLPFGAQARASALGEAYTAERNDAASMYWNAASIYFVGGTSLVVSSAWASEIMTGLGAISFPIGESDAVGIGMFSAATRSARTNLEHEMGVFAYGADVTYAHAFSHSFGVGVGAALRMGKLRNYELVTGYSSFGVFYSPTPEVSYSASFGGLGESILVTDNGTSMAIHRNQNPGNIEIGVSMRFPAMKERVVSFSLANEKILSERGLRYKGGFEYHPISQIALRAGYYVQPDGTRPSYGLGFSSKKLQLDYAYIPKLLSSPIQQVSLLLHF